MPRAFPEPMTVVSDERAEVMAGIGFPCIQQHMVGNVQFVVLSHPHCKYVGVYQVNCAWSLSLSAVQSSWLLPLD